MIRGALLALFVALAAPLHALDCTRISFEGTPFTACEVDPAKDDLRLFLNQDRDTLLGEERSRRIGHFVLLETLQGPTPFAMNGGMYHANRRPVGLYIEDGQELAPLVPGPGPGNFGMVPNGVFCIEAGRARVIETRAYAAAPPDCRFATQSGPMLVIDGALHPRFLPESSSRYVRNGVGTSADGSRVVFAISDRPVTFHLFARLFSEGYGLPNALYLDGGVSRLHAPALGRSDSGAAMGPIIAVTGE